MYIIYFFNFAIISIFILFDLKFVWWQFYCHYMYKIVIMENSYYKKKYLYFIDSNFLCYMNIFVIWFSHAIRLAKSGRQFLYKIL